MPTLDGTRLTLEDIVAVARHGAGVALDPVARDRVAASYASPTGWRPGAPSTAARPASAPTATRCCRPPSRRR